MVSDGSVSDPELEDILVDNLQSIGVKILDWRSGSMGHQISEVGKYVKPIVISVAMISGFALNWYHIDSLDQFSDWSYVFGSVS